MKKKILTILGTRPELIKMFPVVKELDKTFNNKLIWSGQHYDFAMVKKIFKDVKLRKPDLHIKIKKNRNSFFQIQEQVYKVILRLKPDAIVYHGDTFTTLATSLVSNFFFPNIKRIHVEGGYRSGDKTQIEEKARTTSDLLSNVIFVQRNEDKIHLKKENIKKNVFVVGNSIFESINKIKYSSNKKILDIKFNKLKNDKFIYVTAHRSENVDNDKRLFRIIKIINLLSKSYKIIFPIHPRTSKKFELLGVVTNPNILLIPPISYSESIYLLSKCFFCFSDSGGLQEEAIILKKRCLIPSNKTPHGFYLDKNANHLVNIDNKNYLLSVKNFIKSVKSKKLKKFLHIKNTSKQINKILKKII